MDQSSDSSVPGGGRATVGDVQQAVRMTMDKLKGGGYMRNYQFSWGASPGLEPSPQQLQQQLMQQASADSSDAPAQSAPAQPNGQPETFQVSFGLYSSPILGQGKLTIPYAICYGP